MRKFFQLLFFFISLQTWATHNRAGEISYTKIGVNQYEVKIVTYTKKESDADRPFIELNWGDGIQDSLAREIGFPELVDDDIFKNVYIGIHNYPGPGEYTISFEDPNRNEGVNNIPNSVNVPFYVESKILINPFLGSNNSPVLLNPPIDGACIGSPFIHNPSAFDDEGDQLVYSLITPKGLGGKTIDGYSIPSDISVDSSTGTVTWIEPKIPGEYNFAILIEEYRNGFLVGSMIRDMQVTVEECDNHPPQIKPIQNICIEAGQNIQQIIKAYDIDSADVVTLSASGGPITEVQGNLATFPNGIVGIDSVSGTFEWNTQCVHVRKSPYQVIFKAEDNDADVPLIDLATLNITVIAPSTKNPIAKPQLNGIQIDWDSNICSEAIGYKIYRKVGPTVWEHDTCETGVPAYTGYKYLTTLSGINNTSYFDGSTVDGNTYCYRIVACFSDGAESYSSEEVCAEPIEISPIPTHVDVLITDPVSGEIKIQWDNPRQIDSLTTAGPFCYKVYQVLTTGKKLVYTSTGLTDTTFVHQNINTEDSSCTYQIELISKEGGIETVASISESATSVYLSVSCLDKALQLSWTDFTPWKNDTFIVLKETAPGSGIFNPLDTITDLSYIDTSLINNEIYCYQILSLGFYTSSYFDTPFLNHSQIKCGVPKDNVPPCPPASAGTSNCTTKENQFIFSSFDSICDGDLQRISVYFKPTPNSDYVKINDISEPKTDSIFTESNLLSVAGCYAFTISDTTGNESDYFGELCFDNCPIYELPNIFTPDGNSINELFVPIRWEFIESIEITIYNRWGQQVFSTSDININWDGTNEFTGLKSSSGVYFYKCEVKEIRLSGIQSNILNGFVHLIR